MSSLESGALLPVVVQDRLSRQVLMVAFANDEAVRLTRTTGWAHFYSRSRGRLWKKGETSGHVLRVHTILEDCDQDALIYLATARYPVCHNNTASCFGNGSAWRPDPLVWLADVVQERLSGPKDRESYTQKLAESPERAAQKVGEEAVEVAIAAVSRNRSAVVAEVSDLLYHLAVLMATQNVSWESVTDELVGRHSSRDGSRTSPI